MIIRSFKSCFPVYDMFYKIFHTSDLCRDDQRNPQKKLRHSPALSRAIPFQSLSISPTNVLTQGDRNDMRRVGCKRSIASTQASTQFLDESLGQVVVKARDS